MTMNEPVNPVAIVVERAVRQADLARGFALGRAMTEHFGSMERAAFMLEMFPGRYRIEQRPVAESLRSLRVDGFNGPLFVAPQHLETIVDPWTGKKTAIEPLTVESMRRASESQEHA